MMSGVQFLTVLIYVIFLNIQCSISQPDYANDYPYKKYGYQIEGSAAGSDGSRYFKNNLRDRDGRLKANADIGSSFNLDANKNEHDLNQLKRGGSTDNLTHVQGEDFETDKSHKRKHIKSGFQNSYHKDENGSRVSYYEDSDDTGGKVIYDKRHGQRGDNQESQFNEGLRNGITRDRYDDRKIGFDNRDLQDQHRYLHEENGKKHGYVDNFKGGIDNQFEIVRRPYSDHYRHSSSPSRLRDLDDYDRYNPSNHWGYNSRLPSSPNLHSDPSPSRDVFTRRKITIFEDPRDEFVDPKVDRFHDNGNYMTRSEITRRFDYGPAERTPFRTRYRGL